MKIYRPENGDIVAIKLNKYEDLVVDSEFLDEIYTEYSWPVIICSGNNYIRVESDIYQDFVSIGEGSIIEIDGNKISAGDILSFIIGFDRIKFGDIEINEDCMFYYRLNKALSDYDFKRIEDLSDAERERYNHSKFAGKKDYESKSFYF
jgi:hypothetical protein